MKGQMHVSHPKWMTSLTFFLRVWSIEKDKTTTVPWRLLVELLAPPNTKDAIKMKIKKKNIQERGGTAVS
jgi:hypothetical protein